MVVICVAMNFLIGGALIGMRRVSEKLPKYEWNFSTEVDKNADLVIYMNDNRFYEDAKKLQIQHIIQRKTGERSLKIPTPDDLSAVICASKKSFEHTTHKNKVLIYNGVDFEHLNKIQPKNNIDLLVAESRIGIGQRVHLACEYALKNNRRLTILGNGEGLAEDTYNPLTKKYPQFSWIGRVLPDEALSYIKGCNELIVSNPSHGMANQIIEATAFGKKITKFHEGIEIPTRDQIDLNETARKYDELIQGVLNGKL